MSRSLWVELYMSPWQSAVSLNPWHICLCTYLWRNAAIRGLCWVCTSFTVTWSLSIVFTKVAHRCTYSSNNGVRYMKISFLYGMITIHHVKSSEQCQVIYSALHLYESTPYSVQCNVYLSQNSYYFVCVSNCMPEYYICINYWQNCACW